MKLIKTIDSCYKTIRIRTLFADRGGGTLSSVATRVDLLSENIDEGIKNYWTSRHLRFSEKFMRYDSIESLMTSLTSGGLEIDSLYVGFHETEEPSWEYSVSKSEGVSKMLHSASSFVLSGTRFIENSPSGTESQFENELKLYPRITFSSISEMSQHLIGIDCESLKEKKVNITAPAYLRIDSAWFHNDKISLKLTCNQDIVQDLRAWIMFTFQNGDLIQFQPRFRNPDTRVLPNSFIEVSKAINVPTEARLASSARITISVKGPPNISLDYADCINWPVANVVRALLNLLDRNKVSKYFKIDNFENTYSSMGGGQDDYILESVVASSFTSCGFEVLWTGVFTLSCEDILVFLPDSKKVLVVECTTGTALRKIGQMKTALRNLRNQSNWMDFIGVIVTSNSSNAAERDSALRDNIFILDVTNLKDLIQMTTEPPNPDRILALLGLSQQ
jgi:hypothetical protein